MTPRVILATLLAALALPALARADAVSDLRATLGKLQPAQPLVASGYQRMYSCSPDLTFVPYAGVVYYADFALRAEHCVLGLYRDAPFSRVGVLFEPTVRRVRHKHAG